MVTLDLSFYLAAAVLLGLMAESCVKLLKKDSSCIAIAVYVTILGWYFVDPFINPEQYDRFPSYILGESYKQVLLFLIGFRLFMPIATRWILRRPSKGVFDTGLTPDRILIAAGVIWLVLLAIGIYRMHLDVIAAMFPIDSRGGEMTMWSRGALSSAVSGSLVAWASYLFNAVTAILGVLIFFQRGYARVVAGVMFAITLPYFFLEGARSHFLAAIMPFILTYLLYGRHLLIIRVAVLAFAFVCLNEGFKFVQTFRNTGFREVLTSGHPYELLGEATGEDARTIGLNMIQELCYVNAYLDSGDTSPAYGARYLNELLNFVPRAIWPSKPLIGIDYAKWRGYESEAGGTEDELGVFATVSTGMIGGGVLNFGQILGPVAAGILMALWTGLLIRWWQQRRSLLRFLLFMLGAGLTFNLGRDISLLVLWPLVIAYSLIRLAEIWATKQFGKPPQTPTVAPADAAPVLASRLT